MRKIALNVSGRLKFLMHELKFRRGNLEKLRLKPFGACIPLIEKIVLIFSSN